MFCTIPGNLVQLSTHQRARRPAPLYICLHSNFNFSRKPHQNTTSTMDDLTDIDSAWVLVTKDLFLSISISSYSITILYAHIYLVNYDYNTVKVNSSNPHMHGPLHTRPQLQLQQKIPSLLFFFFSHAHRKGGKKNSQYVISSQPSLYYFKPADQAKSPPCKYYLAYFTHIYTCIHNMHTLLHPIPGNPNTEYHSRSTSAILYTV